MTLTEFPPTVVAWSIVDAPAYSSCISMYTLLSVISFFVLFLLFDEPMVATTFKSMLRLERMPRESDRFA
jgi:hypothetical protein